MHEKADIVGQLENYFTNIFSAALPDGEDTERVSGGINRRISVEVASSLDAPFTPKEIRAALFETRGRGNPRA